MGAPAKAGKAAAFVYPMKARGSEVIPEGQWLCEIKFDGYRAVAVLNDGRVELWSRNHKPLNDDYPDIVSALAGLKCRNAVLDGEVAALDARGRSRFQLLQNRGSDEPLRLVFYLFDVMHLNGRDTTSLPIEERSALLRTLLKSGKKPLQLSPSFAVAPADLMKVARQQGLEGIIAKRPGSPYEPGARSGAWLKCKLQAEQEFVIGGFTEPKNSREFFGAILVGYYLRGKLTYAGKVGTGFDRKLLQSLHERFLKLSLGHCPFANLPMARKPRREPATAQA